MCEFYLPYGAIIRSKLNNFCKLFEHHARHLVRALHMTALIVTFHLSDLLSVLFLYSFSSTPPFKCCFFQRSSLVMCSSALGGSSPSGYMCGGRMYRKLIYSQTSTESVLMTLLGGKLYLSQLAPSGWRPANFNKNNID